jgi:hypothetical protein
MKTEEQVFFNILRSLVWGTPLEIPANVDWQEVLNIAARQKCLHAFSVWTKSHRIATPFDKQLQPAVFMVLQRQARLNHLAADVVKLLSQNNLTSVLIKGYSLSVLYPDPDTRDFGDVDIFVGQTDYKRATEILTTAYPQAYWKSDLHGGIHYILVIDESLDRVVELHRVTMEFSDKNADKLYQDFTHKYLNPTSMDKIDICGQKVLVPSAAYNALYTFMHAWHHFESTGVGFRQLGDWALCLKQAYNQLSAHEWELLTQEMHAILLALKMKTAWQTFGHILVDELHLPVEAFPFYTQRYKARAKRLLRQLMRDGHGGRPVELRIKEIALMRRFPFERPSQYRLLQKGYTFCRLLFEAIQMGKLFPDLAWHELMHSLLLGTKKHT